MCPGVGSASKNEYQENSWRPYHLHSAESRENPEALTFWIPKGRLRPVAGELYIQYLIYWYLTNVVVKRFMLMGLKFSPIRFFFFLQKTFIVIRQCKLHQTVKQNLAPDSYDWWSSSVGRGTSLSICSSPLNLIEGLLNQLNKRKLMQRKLLS
jgi:hypothetical protein